MGWELVWILLLAIILGLLGGISITGIYICLRLLLGGERIMVWLKKLFCWHKHEHKYWYPMDKEGKTIFKDTGLLTHCTKCGDFHLIYPREGKDE